MAAYLAFAFEAIVGKVTSKLSNFEIARLTNCHESGNPQIRQFGNLPYNSFVLGIGISVFAAAAASAAGYQSMAPTGQLYGRTFTGLPRGSSRLALTYDDGPNDPYTLRLLEVLAKYHVRATFFLIGRYVQQRPDIVREVVRAGHVIGNHTFTHPNLIFTSSERTRSEITQCRQAIENAVGEHSNLFRPPFGGRRPGSLRVVREIGLQPVMWNVTGWDWDAPPAAHIESKVVKQIRGGNVILLHDGGHKQLGADRAQTVIATDRLIARYQGQYQFVTVPEMMAADPRSATQPSSVASTKSR